MAEETKSQRVVQRIGEFQVEGVLGRGGMGVVFAGRSEGGEEVAIKVIRLEDEEPSFRERFLREGSIRVDHPNVIRVLGSGEYEGRPYIAFERLVGETLRDRMKREPLRLSALIDVMAQLCRGLDAVHQLGVIHRDLKPSNVFLCEDGTAKLLDFGVARYQEQNVDLTQGAVIGTPSYLSPEQARGDAAIDGRSDIFAVGVLLYEALTGRGPFRRDSPLSTMMAVIMDEPVSLSRLVTGLPSSIIAIVERCLAKNRSMRFADASSLLEALESVRIADDVELFRVPDRDLATATNLGGTLGTHSAGSTTIAPNEQRLVATLVASGVVDAAGVEDALVARGASVFRLIGNQVIAVFGVQKWEGDELLQAVRGGLEVRSRCERLGVATGRAFQKGRFVAGRAVDRAEAAMKLELAGIALPADHTRLLLGQFVVQDVGEGFSEVTGESYSVTTTIIPEAKLRGRDAELSTLRAQLNEAIDNQAASAAVVTGPLGVGKSRLIQELLDKISDEVRIFSGRSDPRRQEVRFQLITSMLLARAQLGTLEKGWADISPDATATVRRDGVRALCREAHGDDLPEGAEEFMGQLLGIPMPETSALVAARKDAQLMSDRLRMMLLDYFKATVAQGPVALVLDDVEQSDEASIALLEELLDELAFEPLFVLIAGRPQLDDRYPGLLVDRGAARVQLGPLRPGPASQLAKELSTWPLPRDVLKELVERTDGNPLFITEIVQSMREPTDLRAMPLPLTVEAAVQSRLDQLADEERAVLKRASIFGRSFTPEGLETLGAGGAEDTLKSLAQRGLVAGRQRAAGAGGGREYHFRSSLMADASYDSMSPEFRAELHRRLANTLDKRDEPDAEELAYHWERANDSERAAVAYARAAFAAEQRGDANEILRCSSRAFELGAPANLHFGLHMSRADTYRFQGDRTLQLEELEKAAMVAASDLDSARAATERGLCAFRLGKRDEAMVAAQDAVSFARGAHDAAVLAVALGRKATLHLFTGEHQLAKDCLEEASSLGEGGSTQLRARLAEWRGLLANAVGDVGEQMRAFQEATELYSKLGDVRRAAGTGTNAADAHNRLANFEEAEEALRDATARCRRVGNRIVEGYALVNLAYALASQERLEEALETLSEAAVRAEASDDKRLAFFVELYKLRCAFTEELDSQSAQDISARAEAVASEAEALKLQAARVLALSLAARALLLAGRTAEALERSADAMKLRDELGGLSEDEAEVFLIHAQALVANDKPDEARHIIERAKTRIDEVASKIADEALRMQFLHEVPAHQELNETLAEL